MTDEQFSILFAEALKTADRDAFVSDWTLSSLWEDKEDDGIPPERIDQIGAVWDVAHMTIRQIRAHTGLTQAAFATRFVIPKRSIGNWETGQSECPAYVRLMLAQLTGAYQRP